MLASVCDRQDRMLTVSRPSSHWQHWASDLSLKCGPRLLDLLIIRFLSIIFKLLLITPFCYYSCVFLCCYCCLVIMMDVVGFLIVLGILLAHVVMCGTSGCFQIFRLGFWIFRPLLLGLWERVVGNSFCVCCVCVCVLCVWVCVVFAFVLKLMRACVHFSVNPGVEIVDMVYVAKGF